MGKVIIAEGKTTNEAINNGLKQLQTTKENVTIKVLEEEKRMFFSILTPRVVKVEMTLKDKIEKQEEKPVKKEKRIIKLSKEEQEKAKQNVEEFLAKIVKNFEGETTYEVTTSEEGISVDMMNKNLGFLIGYRGDTLYAFQDILSSIASKGNTNRVRVILDIEKYKAKRVKTLEDLAERMAKIVVRTRKDIKLEPMKPYERKIIHSKLQENSKVETKSVGEEPRRRLVISYKKNK